MLSEYLEAFIKIIANGGKMVLHFNLCNVFLVCIGLMFCQALLGQSLIIGAIFLLLWVLYLKYYKKPLFADSVFALALLTNLWYVLSSWGNIRQYDYFNFYMHAVYFIENDFFLDEPTGYLQSVYFQPPLWGAITGIVTKMMMLLGKKQEQGFDFVRFVSLFAISGGGVIFWRFMEELNFSLFMKRCLWVLFLFMPINGILANLVNNDALVYFLMLGIIYLAYLWNKDESLSKAIYISGLLFLAGMVKFSGLMVVPALGILVLFKLLLSKGKIAWRLWGQLGLMALGSILGFAWGIFLWYHDFPLVPPPMNVDFQNMAQYSLMDRLFLFDTAFDLYADVFQGQIEANVWLALVKTFLFGEWPWQSVFGGYLLYGIGLILALLLVISFMMLFFYPLGEDFTFNGFVIMLIFAVFGAWINFWLDYPYFCSSEFRYVVILWPVSLLALGNFFTKKSLPKIVNYLFAGLIALAILGRIMLYLNTI